MDGIRLKGRRCVTTREFIFIILHAFCLGWFFEMVLISWALLDQMAIILMQYTEHTYSRKYFILYVVHRLYVFLYKSNLQLQYMEWPWSEQCGCMLYVRECYPRCNEPVYLRTMNKKHNNFSSHALVHFFVVATFDQLNFSSISFSFQCWCFFLFLGVLCCVRVCAVDASSRFNINCEKPSLWALSMTQVQKDLWRKTEAAWTRDKKAKATTHFVRQIMI